MMFHTENRWELHDRIFSEDSMYSYVENQVSSRGLNQSCVALPLAKRLHSGQVRKGKDAIPYIYHPLIVACHALSLGLFEDEIIASCLLHDTIEDCGVSPDELPVSESVRNAVILLSFSVMKGESKIQAKERYYKNISENRTAVIVKIMDRCSNVSSMTQAFSREKMSEYIDETEKYVLPLLDCMHDQYPELHSIEFLLRYHMLSVIESVKRIIQFR